MNPEPRPRTNGRGVHEDRLAHRVGAPSGGSAVALSAVVILSRHTRQPPLVGPAEREERALLAQIHIKIMNLGEGWWKNVRGWGGPANAQALGAMARLGYRYRTIVRDASASHADASQNHPAQRVRKDLKQKRKTNGHATPKMILSDGVV